MGWIACCVLVALMLPLGAMLYLDILDAKIETKRALEKLEKIEQRIERRQRDKDRKEPESISDNPVFDRVRRPL
jgi:sensor domain CHASE-containing protein